MSSLPALFISHGSPDIAIADTEARRFMSAFAQTAPRPDAIVVVSAHFEAGGVAVTSDRRPVTIHDFGGFSPELYKIEYAAPGDPDLAGRIACMMHAEGLAAGVVADRGFDHGTWVPLSLMYPDADIPVVQVSVDPHAGPEHHYRIGHALAPLRSENVLVMGSGSMTHNLKEAFAALRCGKRNAETPDWVTQFVNWMDLKIKSGDLEALLDYRSRAPHAMENHPTDEHLMPLYSAIGAAGETWTPQKLHTSHDFGVLSMDAYAFS
ncbi:DODA-type extradiol aromatic ring-opening family dioxygenase [Hoeflea prorocentri]|uniref:Class III extradiol ring-cleavage dioxygenase n=1 Tax=Hoeflea prorocentri TaxID=1922333 RepID=A0A9X3UGM3_9HYPH|nr:class III extradiol ring-cleavage dioxygenase [Hoeflea prorocentri]MCY6380306.1 class III extradiol ring-cleavage dioxygenase [Hoeflea prorocentri]MDA5398106.1 class III extradiol ring-cleavage dioxygenase [Hoeflea prorocentri]